MDRTTPAEVVTREATPYVGLRRTVAMADIAQVADCVPQLLAWLGERGLAPAGPPLLRYRVVGAGDLEVDAGVPLGEPVDVDAEVVCDELPTGRYATLTHTGDPGELRQVTAGLLAWAAEQGLTWDVDDGPEGEHWAARLEVFLTDPRDHPDPSTWQTQLLFKLAP